MTNDREMNARVGYQVAMNLSTHEEQSMWTRSRVMLVANSIIIVAIGWSLNRPTPPWFRLSFALLALSGILLCFLWLCLVERTHKKADLWALCAREFERRYL